MEIIDVSVTSLAVSPGEPVRVEANVHNPTDEEAEFGVALLVDEVTEEERLVRLPAGATRTLRFTVVRSEPGVHVVRVGPHAATFQVLSARFLVLDLIVNPQVVAPGEPISIRAAVENVGTTAGMFQVPLAINGIVVDVRNGLLAVGQSTAVHFETVAQVSGSYVVAVGDLMGAFTVVSPTFDILVPSSIRISLPTTTGTDDNGASLTITQDTVTLKTASDSIEITLPVALQPGDNLGTFRDSVSGISYDDATLLIPLRDALYREVARLVMTPGLVEGQGTTVRVTVSTLLLVMPDTPLQLPPSTAVGGPLSFGMEVPLENLRLDEPLRLIPGVRPVPKMVAAVELEARKRGKTLAGVAASARVEVPARVSKEQGSITTVAFGVPSSWLVSVGREALEVVLIRESGPVELFPITETVPMGDQTLLKSEVSESQGIFVLVVLSAGAPPKISQVIPLEPVTFVGVPVEIRAIVKSTEGEVSPTNGVLRVNNEPVAVAPIRSLEDGSRAAVFYQSFSAPGSYDLDVEGQGAGLQAGLRDVSGHVQVFQLSVNPKQVVPGEPVEVRATLGNVGPRAVVSEAVLMVNGSPVEQRLLAISSGDTTDLSFELNRNRDGTYRIELVNARGEFSVVTEPTAASFQITDLKVEPFTADVGKPVTATFSIRNSGELAGSYLARVFLDKQEVARSEIEVPELTTLPVAFSLQPKGEGVFTVEVGPLRRDFVVVSPRQRSDLVLETLSIEPSIVAGGELTVVTLNIRNRASQPASGVITVLVNEEVVAERDVTAEGLERTQETFFLSQDAPGLYQVEVRQGMSADVVTDVLKGQFLVTRKQSPASWEISLLQVTPETARPQESLTVSFLLSNLGQQEGDFTVTVEINGAQEVEETLRIGAQTTRNLTFPIQGRAEGTYLVVVNGKEVQFTVERVDEELPPVAVTPVLVPTERGINSLIFAGFAAALVVLVVAGYGLFRRRSGGLRE